MAEEPILSPLFQPNPGKPIPPEVRLELETKLIPAAEMIFTRIAQIIREYGGRRFDISTVYGIDFGITRNAIPMTEGVLPVEPPQPPTVEPPPPPAA